jgi:predicted RNA-binding Zn ribbon-like protein
MGNCDKSLSCIVDVVPPAERHPLSLVATTPSALVPTLNLINAHAIGGSADAFRDTASATAYLSESGFLTTGVRVTPSGLRKLRSLRGALIAAIEGTDVDGRSPWAVLDELAPESPVLARFGSDPPASALVPAGSGVNAIVAEVLVAVHDALADGTWRRVRLCALEVCHSAFYDATRSGTQRWHSYAMCGNRTNVAAHRAKKSASAPT